jgi:hypothetical protein
LSDPTVMCLLFCLSSCCVLCTQCCQFVSLDCLFLIDLVLFVFILCLVYLMLPVCFSGLSILDWPCFVCLHPVSCVPNVASLFLWIVHSVFSYVCLQSTICYIGLWKIPPKISEKKKLVWQNWESYQNKSGWHMLFVL